MITDENHFKCDLVWSHQCCVGRRNATSNPKHMMIPVVSPPTVVDPDATSCRLRLYDHCTSWCFRSRRLALPDDLRPKCPVMGRSENPVGM